jgi:arsenate reductase-like glutaredoxin family protein
LADQTDTEIIERDYARHSLTAAEIEAIFGANEIPPFLNTRHAIYKARGWAQQLPARQELIETIIAEPNLLRRPVLRRGKRVVIGFEPEQYRQLIIGQ